MVLVKQIVCACCYSVGITDSRCICTYSNNYPTIELEFDVCECCGQIINDGNPADTAFNKEQMSRFKG